MCGSLDGESNYLNPDSKCNFQTDPLFQIHHHISLEVTETDGLADSVFCGNLKCGHKLTFIVTVMQLSGLSLDYAEAFVQFRFLNKDGDAFATGQNSALVVH